MEILSAGTKFTINGTQIMACKSFPAMGSAPPKKDVTTTDNKKYKTSIPGLIELGDLNFVFYVKDDNENIARSTEGQNCTYKVEYPDGSADEWKGTHVVYKNEATADEPLTFTVAVSCSTEPVHTNATVTTTSTTGTT